VYWVIIWAVIEAMYYESNGIYYWLDRFKFNKYFYDWPADKYHVAGPFGDVSMGRRLLGCGYSKRQVQQVLHQHELYCQTYGKTPGNALVNEWAERTNTKEGQK
jgi:hypothetical protein